LVENLASAGDTSLVDEQLTPAPSPGVRIPWPTVREEIDAGGGLILHRARPQDAPAMTEAITASLEHLRPFMEWIANEPLSPARRLMLIAGWRHAWDNGGDMVFSMWLGDALVGGCGLHRRHGPHGLEIGYWVHVDHIGKGYATAASRALTTAAFEIPEIDFVEIHHDINNTRSGRVPAKLGYELIGDRPGEVHAPGDDGRDRIWRVTREAWAANTASASSTT
jgi:RimJ/RimL family protein N-acetyltransferase